MEMEVIKMIDWVQCVRFVCHRYSAPRMKICSHKHEFKWFGMHWELRDTCWKWSLFGGCGRNCCPAVRFFFCSYVCLFVGFFFKHLILSFLALIYFIFVLQNLTVMVLFPSSYSATNMFLADIWFIFTTKTNQASQKNCSLFSEVCLFAFSRNR